MDSLYPKKKPKLLSTETSAMLTFSFHIWVVKTLTSHQLNPRLVG